MHSLKTISNNKIKEIVKLHQKKYRDEKGLFLAEGEKALKECLSCGVEILEIYAQKEFDTTNINCEVVLVSESEMKKISTTETACEVLFVAKKVNEQKEKFQNFKKIALVDSVSDPGNLGTIIRSACAFGIEGIILYGNCVDLYSSKVIRSCTGNVFKIPVIMIKSIDELKSLLNEHSIVATALSKENNISLKECSQLNKYVVMFGSEAKGLCKELINIADKNIRLKMKNGVESLNLAICASIVFYELFINE